MEFRPNSIDALQIRISKLEKENRFFKRAGLAALAGVALLAIMAQAPMRKTIEANEFVVKDAHGNARIRIGVDPKNGAAELWLQTANSDEGASLSDAGLVFQQNGVVRTVLENGNLSLANSGGQANVKFSADDDAERDLTIEGAKGSLFYKPGEALEVTDSDGYEAAIGSTDVRGDNGSSARTNAASVVLTDPDQKVLWKAP
ncbi:MAG TPA: hypothetical protein VMB47_06020 [Candidatus Aquilonibacter sp.]|nr:hypothetical protein [Candidatus Aquilonibacter sp.]